MYLFPPGGVSTVFEQAKRGTQAAIASTVSATSDKLDAAYKVRAVLSSDCPANIYNRLLKNELLRSLIVR